MMSMTRFAYSRRRWRLIAAAAVALMAIPSVRAEDPPAPTDTAETAKAAEPIEIAEAVAPEGGIAGVLPIEGAITDVMVDSLKRRIKDARAEGAKVIIFDMDTPGGMVTSSITIADLIKNLNDIKTVAWVNPNAHSGGSIVAVACDEIVMARSSRMGNSQVILGGPGGAQAVPEELQPKAYTPVLAEFRASARLNGYDEVLCEAFVLPDREVWWIENRETKERKFVFRKEKLELFGEKETKKADGKKAKSDEADEESDTEEDAETDAARADTPWRVVDSYYDPVLDMDIPLKGPIVPSNQLLEMSAGEAQAYGFSKGMVPDEDALKKRYGVSLLVRFAPTWSEHLAYWLTSGVVRGFLMVIILLAAYVEFHTPGVGVPGLVALICLAIFVGAPYLTGLANVWEIALILVGILLIALEVFVIPGFGVAGIAGLILLVAGLLATFVPPEPGRTLPLYLPSLPSTIHALKVAIITLVCSMGASLVGVFVLSRFLPRVPAFRRIVPANPTPSEVLVEDPYHGAARVGDRGVTAGPLRPAGKARFGGVLVDVVTQGDYLDSNTTVEVIEHRGNRVVVRAAT